MLLSARRVLTESCLARFPERLGEQPVGAVAVLVGAEVVDLVEILAVNGCKRDELEDVDGARRFSSSAFSSSGSRTTYLSFANS